MEDDGGGGGGGRLREIEQNVEVRKGEMKNQCRVWSGTRRENGGIEQRQEESRGRNKTSEHQEDRITFGKSGRKRFRRTMKQKGERKTRRSEQRKGTEGESGEEEAGRDQEEESKALYIIYSARRS